MLFDEALQYLLGLGHETLAIKLGLKNIGLLLSALDHPQSSYPSVQIAGTNGKGSTCVMLEKIARSAGVKAGLYTSPHLSDITERIKIQGREIERADFARLATLVRRAAEALRREGKLETLPTFFEQVTAIALLAFKEAGVQLAILETGLGGRLDATTAAGAKLAAITPIAIDHQEYLGETLAEIAGEKAAIIGAGCTAVIAPQEREVLEVILKHCREVNVTPLFATDVEVTNVSELGRLSIRFMTDEGCYEEATLGLLGRHQAVNAGVAIRLAEVLRSRGFSVSSAAMIEGLKSAEHAGRLELWEGSPSVLFDGAHNRASARALHDYLSEFIEAPVTLIFGAMHDKELTEMAALLFPHARHLILTEMHNPRAAMVEMLLQAAPADFHRSKITATESVEEALSVALVETPPEGLVCITGSLYLVGEAQSIWRSRGWRIGVDSSIT